MQLVEESSFEVSFRRSEFTWNHPPIRASASVSASVISMTKPLKFVGQKKKKLLQIAD
jgi:hypothetical protein